MTVPMTMEQVRAELDPEEPDYDRAARLGPPAIPYLQQLVEGDDPMLAAKAAYLASLIQSNAAIDVVWTAARSQEDIVRVAAAAGLRNLEGKAPASLVESLLTDQDTGVRSTSLNSIAANPTLPVRDEVERMAASDPEPALRERAAEVLSQHP